MANPRRGIVVCFLIVYKTFMIKGQNLLYARLAWLFPLLSPLKTYVRETRSFGRLIRKHSRIRVRSLLHLGCGAGHNDSVFKKSFLVTGVDRSRAMLARARKLNPEATYRLANIRTVRLGRTFDAVAAVDSLDYMLTVKDLRAAFLTAYRHLKSGGVFFFLLDNTKENLEKNRLAHWTTRSAGVTATFLEIDYDPDPTDTSYETDFISLVRRGGKLEVVVDIHRCGLFRKSAILRLLRETGFRPKCFSYRPVPEAIEPSGLAKRTRFPLFIAFKPQPRAQARTGEGRPEFKAARGRRF